MEVITSKKCTTCFEVLPIQAYRFMTLKMRYTTQCRHCESRRAMERQRKIKAAQEEWTPSEVEVIHERYPMGGSLACRPYLPGRTNSQIQSKARREGVAYEAGPVSGSPPKETAWAVPAHEYTPMDMAFRNWRGPVGTIVPSVGTVMGVAA